ncbi:MAG: hypothetical protein ACSW8G_05665 [Bacillota bacterium]
MFAVVLLILILLALKYVPAPREYRKYKQSNYYKKYGQKYKVGMTCNRSFPVIEYLLQENIPYDDFTVVDDVHRLVIGDTNYLFPWFEEILIEDDGKCMIAIQDNYDYEPLAEEEDIKNTDNPKVIINRKDYPALNVEKARDHELLVVYEELTDLKELLK